MTEIIFKDNSIQTGYRVKIPKAIVDTLNLEERQKIRIRFDAEKRIMIVEEDGALVGKGKGKIRGKGGKNGK